ncbi:MAG: ImmA/IrrE family metallo-endopeptidase [Tissierellia bacterium]|nr:ImmA/IrrE family metallo-endopeptidase [Tissierellia bacterium]
MNDIKRIVERVVRKYKTRDPEIIASDMGIVVLYEPLGSLRGYFNTCRRQKFIHINNSLKWHERRLVTAHELGHAVLHPNANTPFMRSCTHFSISRMENQANTFAGHLLIPDDELEYYSEYSIDQLAMLYGVPQHIVKLRLGI